MVYDAPFLKIIFKQSFLRLLFCFFHGHLQKMKRLGEEASLIRALAQS